MTRNTLLLIIMFVALVAAAWMIGRQSPINEWKGINGSVPDREIKETKVIAEMAKLYPQYRDRKNLTIKYYYTMETHSDYDPNFKEYNEELPEQIMAVIKENPIAFDGRLPSSYKKVFYENNKIIWEEIYSWKGLILRFHVVEADGQTRTLEHWFDRRDEMEMFVKGTLFQNK